MLNVLLQNANRGRSFLSTFRHLGALGLFFLTILDSSPVPTFCGPDILLTILVTTHRDPWYEYVAVATVGSTIGAYITFRLARKAGDAYLESRFGQARVSASLAVFKKWGTGTLVASTAIPFPFPTSLVFAAAGASEYHLGKFPRSRRRESGRSVRSHRHCCKSIRASLRTDVSASDTVLGLALAVCRRHSFFNRGRNTVQQATADCAGTLNEGAGKVYGDRCVTLRCGAGQVYGDRVSMVCLPATIRNVALLFALPPTSAAIPGSPPSHGRASARSLPGRESR